MDKDSMIREHEQIQQKVHSVYNKLVELDTPSIGDWVRISFSKALQIGKYDGKVKLILGEKVLLDTTEESDWFRHTAWILKSEIEDRQDSEVKRERRDKLTTEFDRLCDSRNELHNRIVSLKEYKYEPIIAREYRAGATPIATEAIRIII